MKLILCMCDHTLDSFAVSKNSGTLCDWQELTSITWSCRFSHTNPLHPDLFPSIARFEAEVVAMTAAMLGSKSKSSGGQVCGNMTSGGTESILMAVKSTRDFMRATRGITAAEM
jgi:glutamate/tyrosine decarboxylase-like PLP-dependent enzyme